MWHTTSRKRWLSARMVTAALRDSVTVDAAP